MNPLGGAVFGPTIEPIHEKAFFTNKTYGLLKNGMFNKVPQIIGFNSREAASFFDGEYILL